MITRRVSYPASEATKFDFISSSGSQIHTKEEKRRQRRDASDNESASQRNGRFSSIVMVTLGSLGCFSLVTQVSFIIYVSSMTFTRLESVLYTPRKMRNATLSKLEAKPRIVGYYFQNISSSTYLGSERLDPNMHRRLTRNVVKMSINEWRRQRHLEASEDYLAESTDPLENGDCVAQYEWQKRSFPTCNLFHELDMNAWSSQEDHIRILSLSGFWRDIWLVNSAARKEKVVLKTLRLRHEFSERNFDRHRRDALAMERLTSSPNVIQMFGYCGNSGITEFADGGSLENVIYKPPNSPGSWNMSEKIIVAYQIATALSDVHNLDKVGRASIAHTDITPANFVYMKDKGRYVLNDFNRCRLIAWNKKLDKPCSFLVGNNPGTVSFKSAREPLLQTTSQRRYCYFFSSFAHLRNMRTTRKLKRSMFTHSATFITRF